MVEIEQQTMNKTADFGRGDNSSSSTTTAVRKKKKVVGPSSSSSSSSPLKGFASLDMYRKVPMDLLEGSQSGRMISWITIFVILLLVYFETSSFFTDTVTTNLALDHGIMRQNDRMKLYKKQGKGQNGIEEERVIEMMLVRFNITMMDLKCEYTSIDLVSVLGKEQNVTKDIHKWSVDNTGVQQQYMERNMLQHDIEIEHHDTSGIVNKSLEELHDNGVDAVKLTPKALKIALENYDFVFVDFFAMWCSHCRALMPTWEMLAEVMNDAKKHHIDENHKKDYPQQVFDKAENVQDSAQTTGHEKSILIAKVDCVEQHMLCVQQRIVSYPTLRLYVNQKVYSGGDFHGHRTILSMIQWLQLAEEKSGIDTQMGKHANHVIDNVLPEHHSEEDMEKNKNFERSLHDAKKDWNPQDHPGCRIHGKLLLNKVPGHFYIQAASRNHEFSPQMANVSHEIHHLSFRAVYIPESLYRRMKTDKTKNLDDIDDDDDDDPLGFHNKNHQRREAKKEKIFKTITKLMKQYSAEKFPHKKENAAVFNKLFLSPKLGGEGNPMAPMNGNVYLTQELHQAYHHYLKLVSINGGIYYQVLANSQLSIYDTKDMDRKKVSKINNNNNNNQIPEAKFVFDVSPITVNYKKENRVWYDYVTSLMAIIGGTFTVVGIIDAFLNRMERLNKLRQHKRHVRMKQRQPQQSGIGGKYNNDVAVAITETPLDNTTGSTLQNRRQQQQYNNAGVTTLEQ